MSLTALIPTIIEAAERAAIACYPHIGGGDENQADQAAVDAMRTALNTAPINGVVVIGEGERDEAPMLYIGEQVGTGGIAVDIALDPVEVGEMALHPIFRQPAAGTVPEYVPYGLPPRLFGAKIATHNAHGDRAISFSWKMPLHAAPPSGTVTPMPPPMSYAHDGPPDPDDSAVPPSPKRPRKTPTQLRDGLVETLSAAASLLCSV